MDNKELEKHLDVFDGYATVKELKLQCKPIPTGKGIYCVFRDSNQKPEFLTIGTGGTHDGRDLNYSVIALKDKWIENENLIYIGKTDVSLRQRIRTYMKFGSGKDVPHRGGRAIWQLKDSDDLIVAWKELPDSISARDIESKMIKEFLEIHNDQLPFANWVE